MSFKVSVSSPVFLGREREYVNDCLDRAWLTQGKYVKASEHLLAEISGTKHAVVCSSGTAALHLGLLALDLRPGDGVLVPAMTYVATANAVTYAGGIPIFCDVEPDTWCMDPEDTAVKAQRARACGINVVGSIPVHMYGVQPPGITGTKPYMGLAPHGWMLEDAAQAVGQNFSAGTLFRRRLATFSFFASKIVAAGEGGALVTDDDKIAARARLYRGQGAPTPGVYYHKVIGYNYRLTDIQAAILLAQLETYQDHARRRRRLMDRYRARLGPSEALRLQERPESAVDWVCAIMMERESAGIIAALLRREGIETRPFFLPLPLLPPYREVGAPRKYPVAYNLARGGLVLPLHCGMGSEDVDYVCDRLLELFR